MPSSKTVEFGFMQIELVPFSNSSFAENTASKQIIYTSDIEAGTPITVQLMDAVVKRQFADGSIWAVRGPNDNPGEIKFTIAKTGNMDDLKALLFPESYKTTSGSLTARQYTATIGAGRTDWSNALQVYLKDPTDLTDQSKWVSGRVMVNSDLMKNFGADNSKIDVVLSLIGGAQLSNGETSILIEGDPDSGTTIV